MIIMAHVDDDYDKQNGNHDKNGEKKRENEKSVRK